MPVIQTKFGLITRRGLQNRQRALVEYGVGPRRVVLDADDARWKFRNVDLLEGSVIPAWARVEDAHAKGTITRAMVGKALAEIATARAKLATERELLKLDREAFVAPPREPDAIQVA